MTYADMAEDFWAHAHADDPKLREIDVDDDFEESLRAFRLEDAAAAPAEDDDEIIADRNYGTIT